MSSAKDRFAPRSDEDVLQLVPSYDIELDHWAHEAFRGTVISPLRDTMFVTFELDLNGQPQALRLVYVERPDGNLRFERVAGTSSG